MESIHFDPYLYWRFTYTWIALRMLMLDGIHQNNVRFFCYISNLCFLSL